MVTKVVHTTLVLGVQHVEDPVGKEFFWMTGDAMAVEDSQH